MTHPYSEYENTPTWKALDKGIADLVANGDLTESTARSHIVGYLAKVIAEHRAAALRPRPTSDSVPRKLLK